MRSWRRGGWPWWRLATRCRMRHRGRTASLKVCRLRGLDRGAGGPGDGGPGVFETGFQQETLESRLRRSPEAVVEGGLWKAGEYDDVSLADGIIEFTKTHGEIKGASLTF